MLYSISHLIHIIFLLRENHIPFYEERVIICILHFLFSLLKGAPIIFMKSKPLEKSFQSKLIKQLKKLFPGCIAIKNDPNYIQGFPDLTIFDKNKWAVLECKRFVGANKQPNQDYYVNILDSMSFSRFINPENKEKVLNELQQTFES